MMVEQMFEMVVILTALIYSRFARLPLMVAGNVIAFTVVTTVIERVWNVSVSPGYEIYYAVGGLYFVGMAFIFARIKDKFYLLVGTVLLVQAMASASMLIWDNFANWHYMINDNMLMLECILVWLSSVRPKCR